METEAGYFDKFVAWAHDRSLIDGSYPEAQMRKLRQEADELSDGIDANDLSEVEDGVGDCMVVLTIIAAQYGLTVDQCLARAWDEIKDRKGQMIDGIFVKDEG